jgi:hypothetical protein
MNLRWCGRLLVCALFFLSLPLAAVERILSYDSYITIDAEGDMTVRETIRVVADGRQKYSSRYLSRVSYYLH